MSFSDLRSCAVCGKTNRVGTKHLANTGKCGACKAALPPLSSPLEVDEAAFDEIVRDAPVPVIVDFWAAWCGPCRMAAPEVEALARELAGEAVVLKVDTERNPQLSGRYDVQSIPNFVVLRGGRVIRRQAGFSSRAHLRQLIAEAGATS